MNRPPQPPEGILGDGFALNYLHYGSVLDDLPSIAHRFKAEKSVCKNDVMTYLQSLKGLKERQLGGLMDVADTFGENGQFEINIDDFSRVIEESRRWRFIFHSLGCRGFSFRLYEHPQIHHVTLKKHVNIRIALAVDPLLYYPPKVRHDSRGLLVGGFISKGGSAGYWELSSEWIKKVVVCSKYSVRFDE